MVFDYRSFARINYDVIKMIFFCASVRMIIRTAESLYMRYLLTIFHSDNVPLRLGGMLQGRIDCSGWLA